MNDQGIKHTQISVFEIRVSTITMTAESYPVAFIRNLAGERPRNWLDELIGQKVGCF